MIQPFMVNTHEAGAFALQFKFAAEQILSRPPEVVAECAGVTFDPVQSRFTFNSLGRDMFVSYPECRATFAETGETPNYSWHIVMLHYLSQAEGVPLSPDLIAYRNMQGGVAYNNGFEDMSRNAIVRELCGRKPEELQALCTSLGGVLSKSSADITATFYFMPKYPMTLQVWLTDDEMEGTGHVLFNARAKHYLSPEDASVAGEVLVDFLIYQLQAMDQGQDQGQT